VQRVAVVRLTFHGDVPEAGQEMFRARLARGLTVARFQVLAGARVREELRGVGCSDPSCYPAMARALGVGYLVVGRVAEDRKTYQIALELVNGRTGAIMGTVRQQCETCGIEEAGEKMDLAASALRARLEMMTRAPARFAIRSQPADAEASIDGQAVGRTPVEVELAGGEHHLGLRLPGHEPISRTFVVVSGVDETLDFALVQEATAIPFRPLGWTALGVGLAGIAAGVAALAMDGHQVACDPREQDPGGHCPLVHRTRLLGGMLVGVGSAAFAVGGLSLYLGGRGSTESTRPAASVAVSGRF
jgi:hypothetical protein